ncbi:MAG: hypothetical protein QXS56_03805 [Fervidicoccaceae archaeon]
MEFLKKSLGIKVSSISDIARLAASSSSPMSPPRNIFRITIEGRTLIFILLSFPNYFELRGLPIVFFYECGDSMQGCKNSPYLAYRVVEGGEQVQFSERSIPGWLMIPIVNVESITNMERLFLNE